MVDRDAPGLVVSVNGQVPDGTDLSWLWDVRFEDFEGVRVVAAGERAADLGVRLTYGGIEHGLVPDTLRAIASCPAGTGRGAGQLHRVPRPEPRRSPAEPTMSEPTTSGGAPSTLRIGNLLPDVMGTYGDGGNALVLRGRARMRGIDAEIVPVTLDGEVPESLDVYVLGGGEDVAQVLATRHLARHPGLQRAAARGVPVLAVCAGLQVLGEWYVASDGSRVDGLGMLDVTTAPQEVRAIGELLVEPTAEGLHHRLTGFENHRGGTTLGPGARPLARVVHGVGNGAGDGTEGMVSSSVIGTYLHGPVLARNPELADLLLSRAVGVDAAELAPLDLPEVELLRAERLAHRPPSRRGLRARLAR